MIDWLYDGIVEWLAEQVVSMLAGLVGFLTDEVFLSPDVTVFPQVQQLAERSLLVVNAAYVLAFITAGLLGMTHGSLQTQYQVKELLPRLVVGLIAANFGVELCGALIEIGNALTLTLAGETAAGPQVVRFVQNRIMYAFTNPGVALLAAVLGVLIVVLLYLLIVSWFGRVAILIVLAGIAPAALACYGLPQTQAVAGLWWRSLLGCLATPVLQALFFAEGVNLLLGPTYRVPELLGADADGSDFEIANLFIATCLLMLTVRIPKLVGRYLTNSGVQRNPAGVLVRAVVMQSVTRGLLRMRPTRATQVAVHQHSHHHYRRLRRIILNGDQQ
ncbi:conjugal transfer protein TrbL family protein [Actinoplanes sp. NPDC023714]|uniref:conjugal transfer protein TrbL family protein n=1 Tax=Actinoplanes sp. NPDC023714 TaxID=3154322 RepID=UPI003402C9E8